MTHQGLPIHRAQTSTESTRDNMEKINIAVIGGGAAGLMSACIASEYDGAKVTLFEKNRSEKKMKSEKYCDNAYLGRKLLITGKGRCNVTNACDTEEFMKNVTVNAKFLYAAINAFDSSSTMKFFEDGGTKLKTERGNRVFPESDRAIDILRVFKQKIKDNGVRVINKKVINIDKNGEVFEVKTEEGSFSFDRVIVCTGGMSYPQTGSTGDGYKFAKSFGHTVKDITPSLVPLECYNADACSDMAGLSLKNVKLTIMDKDKKKSVYSNLGEMLFTHFGISGPLVLSASAHMKKFTSKKYRADIDLKPALDLQKIESKLVKLFAENSNKNLENVLISMLPKSMVCVFCEYCGLSPETKPNSINKQQRRVLAEAFKCFSFEISAFRPVSEAIITSGGVNTKEINPSTMESKLINGLYFAGEIIDVDAYTGGFNLQIAFSTAYLAAKSCVGK